MFVPTKDECMGYSMIGWFMIEIEGFMIIPDELRLLGGGLMRIYSQERGSMIIKGLKID